MFKNIPLMSISGNRLDNDALSVSGEQFELYLTTKVIDPIKCALLDLISGFEVDSERGGDHLNRLRLYLEAKKLVNEEPFTAVCKGNSLSDAGFRKEGDSWVIDWRRPK
jgi:hypothetical protein